MGLHLVTLNVIERDGVGRHLAALAQALDGTVGSPDSNGMLDVELEAESRERALERVRDAIAAAGADDHLTFTETTGTDFVPEGRRAAPPDEQPDPDEPPHLQGGSPHENRPAPYDEE